MATVFELRREGKYQEAHGLAVANFAQDASNKWNRIGLGLTAFDLLKIATEAGDCHAAITHLNEIASINPPTDAQQPEFAAWKGIKLLNQIRKQPTADINLLFQLIAVMLALPLTKPSKVYSVIADNILKLKDKLSDYHRGKYLEAWGLQNLIPEDYFPEEFEGRKSPVSLAESAYIAVAKKLLNSEIESEGSFIKISQPDTEGIKSFLPHIECLILNHPEYVWAPYYRGKLLLAVGDTENAIKVLLPVVRQKSSEFWAWQLLGEVLKEQNPDKALACFYKSANCRTEEIFLGGVRALLIPMLIEAGNHNEARKQVDAIMTVNQKNGYKTKASIEKLTHEEWYANADPTVKNSDFHIRQLETAEKLLFEALDWIPASFIMTRKATEDRPATALLLVQMEPGINVRATVKLKSWSRLLEHLKPGAALQVKADMSSEKPKVFLIEKRSAAPFDLEPAYFAVISNIDGAGKAYFVVNRAITGSFVPAEFGLSVAAGDTVVLKLEQRKDKEGKPFYRVLHAYLDSMASVPQEIMRNFQSQIRLPDDRDFTFIKSGGIDIFFHKNLLPPTTSAESIVEGVAVISFDKKKGIWGWRAVKATILNKTIPTLV